MQLTLRKAHYGHTLSSGFTATAYESGSECGTRSTSCSGCDLNTLHGTHEPDVA